MAAKLYLVTRQDLSAGDQAVQAAHALQQFNIEHSDAARAWYADSNTLAFLAVETEADLARLRSNAERRGLYASSFHEPDLKGALTAIALEPKARSLVQDLPLALRSPCGELHSACTGPA